MGATKSKGPSSRRTPIDKGSYPMTYSQERNWNDAHARDIFKDAPKPKRKAGPKDNPSQNEDFSPDGWPKKKKKKKAK